MTVYKCNQIITEDSIVDGYLVVEDGKFTAILPADADVKEYVDYTSYRIIPGITDTHNHGTMGYTMSDDPEDGTARVKGYLKGLASQGVTGIFPTCSVNMIKTIADVAKSGPQDGARILGIHSEGPYLNRVGEKGIYKGMPTIDMNVYRKMVEDGQGWLRLVAIAPECLNSQEAIDFLNESGVTVAYAHSNDNYEEAMEAFKNGIKVSTHTANVMSGIHHRNMGGLGACLLNDDVQCEVICDGFHVRNEMLEIMFRVKPDMNKWMMVSDNTPLSGAPTGWYTFGGFGLVNITSEGYALTDTGRLAGSTKPVIYGIKNLVENMGKDILTVCKMSSLTTCNYYGFPNKGSIKVGKDADFVAIDENYNAIFTYSEGRKVYDRLVEGDVYHTQYVDSMRVEKND